jgi:hypothetical protein
MIIVPVWLEGVLRMMNLEELRRKKKMISDSKEWLNNLIGGPPLDMSLAGN